MVRKPRCLYSTSYDETSLLRQTHNDSHVDDIWEADLDDLNIAAYNDNIQYLLVVIDVVWVKAVHIKTSLTVAMTQNFERSDKRLPRILQTDRDKEFRGSDLQKVLNKKKIIVRTVRNPDVKTAIVRRFSRT